MTEISDTGRFRPKEEEIDYEAYPCYKQYGPRHGTVNIFTGKLENETFRTAIQVRVDYVDFVRQYDDILKIRMTGLEFLSLAKHWGKVKAHCKKYEGKFVPVYSSQDGKWSIKQQRCGGQDYNKLFITHNSKMSLALCTDTGP